MDTEVQLRGVQESAIPEDMELLRFQSMRNIPELNHALTTRRGGVSRQKYSTLNLGFHVGDDEENVRQNRILLAKALGYEAADLVAARQPHGARAHLVSLNDRGRGALEFASAVPDCDALVVSQKQLPVLIQVADCAPILIVDETQKVLAAVHAGWRGAVGKIVSKTITKMRDEFGTDPGNLRVGIGPCLCTECFEVGEEVAQLAPQSGVILGHRKPHLDLRAILIGDALTVGAKQHRIETLPHCPRCENQTFFSHRAQNGTAGRFGLVAWWQ